FGQRRQGEPLKVKLIGIKVRSPGIVLAIQVQGGTEHLQQVLDGDQVAHFLLGDAKNGLLPLPDLGLVRVRDLWTAHRVGGEQVLDHQRVFYLCCYVKKEYRVIEPGKLRG